jgi:hypothetical protein
MQNLLEAFKNSYLMLQYKLALKTSATTKPPFSTSKTKHDVCPKLLKLYCSDVLLNAI